MFIQSWIFLTQTAKGVVPDYEPGHTELVSAVYSYSCGSTVIHALSPLSLNKAVCGFIKPSMTESCLFFSSFNSKTQTGGVQFCRLVKTQNCIKFTKVVRLTTAIRLRWKCLPVFLWPWFVLVCPKGRVRLEACSSAETTLTGFFHRKEQHRRREGRGKRNVTNYIS